MSAADPASIASRFVEAFSAADFDAMRALLADRLVARVRNAEGGADGRIAECWMADAKPAESDEFWS